MGGFLELCPDTCYVLQDEASICGYAVTAPDMQLYQAFLRDTWHPSMCKKYPRAVVKDGQDPTAAEVSDLLDMIEIW